MSKGSKIFLGILTFLPLVVLIIGIIVMVATIAEADRYGRDDDVVAGIIIYVVSLFLVVGLSIGMTIYYAIHASKNQRVPSSMRTAWVLINIFGGTIAQAIYFFMHVVPDKPESEEVHYPSHS